MTTPHPGEPFPITEPDVIRPPTPVESPAFDVPVGLPAPGPDVVPLQPPPEIPPDHPQEAPPRGEPNHKA